MLSGFFVYPLIVFDGWGISDVFCMDCQTSYNGYSSYLVLTLSQLRILQYSTYIFLINFGMCLS
jgi:hypothetical protein